MPEMVVSSSNQVTWELGHAYYYVLCQSCIADFTLSYPHFKEQHKDAVNQVIERYERICCKNDMLLKEQWCSFMCWGKCFMHIMNEL